MAQYIEREALIAEIEENINTYWNEGGGGYYLAEDALNYSVKTAPTADVVPRSEVESILDGLMKEAREIAERYEKSANETNGHERIEYRGTQIGALLVSFKIAELNKKYTEENKLPKHLSFGGSNESNQN